MEAEAVYTQRKITSEILTVMFIDIVEYTSTSAKMSRDEFFELHNTFDSLAIPIFKQYFGHVVKKIGDAFLVTFKSPTDAVLCGIELQKAFRRYNYIQGDKSRWIRIRVAIHTGEVIHRNNDVYGDAVNATSRIESLAKAGQVMFSEGVYHAMNKNEVPVLFLGAHRLKGVEHPVRLFRVRTHQDDVRMRWEMIRQITGFVLGMGLLAGFLYVLVKYVLPTIEFLPA